MPTAQVTIKRLFQGLASIRTTTIDICIKKNADLKIVYKNKSMTILLEKLKNPHKFQIHKSVFTSKFNPNQTYELYDFPFKPDGEQLVIGLQNDREQIDKAHNELSKKLKEITHRFIPIVGNQYHIEILPTLKKIDKNLIKLKKYKASFSRAKPLIEEIDRQVRNVEFLKNK